MAEQHPGMESSNFDNDFEKLGTDDLVSSSTAGRPAGDMAEEDLYSGSDPMPPSEAESSQPLLSFDDPAPPKGFAVCPPAPTEPPRPAPLFQPDSSTAAAEPSAPPAPATEPLMPTRPSPPKTEVPKKPQVSSGGWFKNIDPRVIELIYWRDPKKTGVVFGSMMVLLLALALFSVLSVVAYLSLAALTVTVTFTVYKKVLQAVQKTGEGHPFKQYLEMDMNIPEEKVHQVADHVFKHVNNTHRELRRLFLVEDLVDSLKFGLLLWVMTYIGSWFNGMTLIILAVVSVFTIPKFYETYKTQIDQYIDLVLTQVKTVMKQIQEKIPLPGKKKQQ